MVLAQVVLFDDVLVKVTAITAAMKVKGKHNYYLLLHWLECECLTIFHKLTSSLVVDCPFLSSSFH